MDGSGGDRGGVAAAVAATGLGLFLRHQVGSAEEDEGCHSEGGDETRAIPPTVLQLGYVSVLHGMISFFHVSMIASTQ
jgi:hypothetical protein